MDKSEIINYLRAIAELCENGNSDDAFVAGELSKYVRAHVEDGARLPSLEITLEGLAD